MIKHSKLYIKENGDRVVCSTAVEFPTGVPGVHRHYIRFIIDTLKTHAESWSEEWYEIGRHLDSTYFGIYTDKIQASFSLDGIQRWANFNDSEIDFHFNLDNEDLPSIVLLIEDDPIDEETE